jgi:hypothetical protein
LEPTQKLNIGISLLLDPNPKLNPCKKKKIVKKGTSSLSSQVFFVLKKKKTNQQVGSTFRVK